MVEEVFFFFFLFSFFFVKGRKKERKQESGTSITEATKLLHVGYQNLNVGSRPTVKSANRFLNLFLNRFIFLSHINSSFGATPIFNLFSLFFPTCSSFFSFLL